MERGSLGRGGQAGGGCLEYGPVGLDLDLGRITRG
jgi:hypothetical protein